MLEDLRHAVRGLARNPHLVIPAVLMLGLGIGACTAIFTLVRAVLLEELPYPEPRELVQLEEINEDGNRMAVPEANFLDWRDESETVRTMAAYRSGTSLVLGGGAPAKARISPVSAAFFDVFAVEPALGRTFTAEESSRGGDMVVVVSRAYWQRILGAPGDLSAAEVRIEDIPFRVVGVMPAGFDFPDGTDLWVPMELLGPVNPSRSAHNWRVVGRLAPGADAATATTELNALAERIHASHADVTAVGALATPLRERLTENVRQPLLVLSAAVVLLLLVAAFNVVNLLLARAATQERSGALRAALGAGRWRLATPRLAESLAIALCGGILGVLLAVWGVDVLLAIEPGTLPREEGVAVDGPVLAFALGLSALLAFLVGMLPGLRAGRVNPREALQESGPSLAGSRSSTALRGLLVTLQVASTLVLLVGSALLARSFLDLLDVDLGYEVDDRQAITLELPPARDDDAIRRLSDDLRQIRERVENLPGLVAAGGSSSAPLTGGVSGGRFGIEGAKDSGDYWPQHRKVSTGYFEALGIPVQQGRTFEESDGFESPHVAVISRRVADRIWPEGGAVGTRIETSNMDAVEEWATIVGIVGDVRSGGPDSGIRGTVYMNVLQRPRSTYTLVAHVREDTDLSTLAPAIRSAVREVRPDALVEMSSLEESLGRSLGDRRFALTLVSAFGLSALLLSLLGLYGALAYSVSQRRKEVGVRLALGASGDDVVGLFLRQGATWIAWGLGLGLVAAYFASRLLASQLHGISPRDPVAYAAATLIALTAGLVSAWVPARRGARVDPTIALR